MRCNSWHVNRPTRSFTIRTDCTDCQIVLLPDQQIDASDCQRIDYYFFSLTDRTDHMIDLTDCISASILDMSAVLNFTEPQKFVFVFIISKEMLNYFLVTNYQQKAVSTPLCAFVPLALKCERL